MNFSLSISPSKEMIDRTSLTSAGIEPTNRGFDQPLLCRLSYEARQEQLVGDYGGNYSNVNVKGTMNQCFVTQMMDVISAIDTTFIVSLNKTWRLRRNTILTCCAALSTACSNP